MRTPGIDEIYNLIKSSSGLKLPEIVDILCPDLTEGEKATAKSNVRSKLSRLKR